MARVGDLCLDCPVCGKELPPIRIVAQSNYRRYLDKQRTLEIDIHPVLDQKW